MSLEKYVSIIQLARAKTDEGKLTWEEGPFSASYVSKIGENAVSIRFHAEDYFMQLFNKDGDVIESISDVDFKGSGYPEMYIEMKSLYDMARRNALGSDKITIDILNALINK